MAALKTKLKLVDVEPAFEVDPIEGFEPTLLATVEHLDRYWPQASEHLARCVDEAMHGELTLQDLYEGIKAGTMYGLVVKNDSGELPEVALAMIFETHTYPQYTVLNITALGGREMTAIKEKFWKHVCSWAYMNGVRKLECSASPAMARILKRFGFESVYTTMRMDITEI